MLRVGPEHVGPETQPVVMVVVSMVVVIVVLRIMVVVFVVVIKVVSSLSLGTHIKAHRAIKDGPYSLALGNFTKISRWMVVNWFQSFFNPLFISLNMPGDD